MELPETKKILAYIACVFPRYYANVTKTSADKQAIVWTDLLKDYSADAVMTGVKSYISVDSSGFPPSPGQIIEHIHFVGNPRDHSGTEAWALVRKAVNVPWDQFEASFATLPRAAQIAVGSPESLKELAQMDTQRFETVAQSNFLRMYEAAQIRSNKEKREPTAALAVRERLQMELEARRSKDLLEASDTKKLNVGETKSGQSMKAGGGVEAPTELMKSLRERLGV